MKLTFDLDELFPDDYDFGVSASETIRIEIRSTVAAATRKMVEEVFESEGEELRERITGLVRDAVAEAAAEIDKMETEDLLRWIL